MCQPKPGPRCTNHAKKNLLDKQEKLQEAISSEDHKKIHSARAAFAIALNEFDSTPGGQKALKEKIEICDSEGNSAKSYSYKKRIEAGKEIRKTQQRALKMQKEGKCPQLSSRWSHVPIREQWTCDNGDEIRVYDDPRASYNSTMRRVWRLRDGQPITMINFSEPRPDREYSVLGSVEVNPDFRGQHLAVDTIKELNSKYGQLYTTGSYSTSGFRSLSEFLPLEPGAKASVSPNVTHYQFVNWLDGDLN